MKTFRCLSITLTCLAVAAASARGALIFTEVMTGASSGSDWQYAEIWNNGGSSIDLGNATFKVHDRGPFDLGWTGTIGAGVTLGAGAVAVLYNSDDTTIGDFASAWAIDTQHYNRLIGVSGWDSIRAADTIEALDSGSASLAQVSYANSAPWPILNPLAAPWQSIHVEDWTAVTDGDSWAASTIGGPSWRGWLGGDTILGSKQQGSPGIVPEPGTIGLGLMALFGAAAAMRRRKTNLPATPVPA